MKPLASHHSSPFTKKRAESLAAWGENKLLENIRVWLGASAPSSPFGMGDDCAVLARQNSQLLMTVDPVIYGRHFGNGVAPAAVGEKLLKRNLSDIAAMGGRPSAAVIALAASATLRTQWLKNFYIGMAQAARKYRVKIVGGDIAQIARGFIATMTLLGSPTGKRTITRGGARAGDWIYVTGELGGSIASGHHYRFQPRLREGAWLARRPEIRAMMDLSDGLAKDLWSLTPAALEPALEAACVPTRTGATLVSALAEGEDYELCVIVGSAVARGALERAWRKKFPDVALTCLGRMVKRGRRPIGAVDLKKYRGYEHLR